MASAPRLDPIRVTRMEMTAPVSGSLLPAPDAAVTIAERRLSVDEYLALYRAVGEPLGWDTRYRLSRDALAAMLASNLMLIAEDGAVALGFIELELRDGNAELMHFGLVPRAQGRRLGPWLLDRGLRSAWAKGVQRIHLHTDDWDHPKARATYLRAGFVVVSEMLEDPTDL